MYGLIKNILQDTIGSPLLAGNVVVGTYVYGTFQTIHIFTNVYKESKFIENATNGTVRTYIYVKANEEQNERNKERPN